MSTKACMFLEEKPSSKCRVYPHLVEDFSFLASHQKCSSSEVFAPATGRAPKGTQQNVEVATVEKVYAALEIS